MPLQGTGKVKGGFVEVVDLDGEEHWAQFADLSQRTRCLVIRVREVRVRQGPGTDFPQALVASSDKYSPFRDLGGQDGWTRVQDDTGAKGWVNLDHVWKPLGHRLRVTFDKDAM
jgi:SH3-like domain-containing protein